jgi:protein TonB
VARGRLVLGASLVAHLVLAGALGAVKTAPRQETVAISMATEKPKPEPPKPADLPKPQNSPAPDARPAPARKAASAAKATPTPAKASPSPVAAAAGGGDLPDFGLSLSGGTGTGGLAIPTGGGGGEAAPAGDAAKSKPAAPKATRPVAPTDDCDEPPVKPRPRSVPQPPYPDRAREARVEGKVRVEVKLDATGAVTGVSLLQGLGHGLDEASLDAARRARFDPATRCGKPVAGSMVLSIRFAIP